MSIFQKPSAETLNTVLLVSAWIALMTLVLITRPLMPIDETRYLSVAWEMWFRNEQLVPHLNGMPYSHKPPLLFWLIQFAWSIFGVSETWARLVAPLCGLFVLLSTPIIYRLLWPTDPTNALLAPWVLLGTFLWSVIATVTMFDMLNALFVVGAVIGFIIASKSRQVIGFAIVGICIGLGILSKGPIIFVYTLPLAILAPWWSDLDKRGLFYWYLGLVVAISLSIFISLLWALPAGLEGGDQYRNEILWGQTAGRITGSFAHARSFWWYLFVLPIALFPWFFCPSVWQGLNKLLSKGDSGLKFCVSWFVPSLILLSIISGKQPHYLIPIIPAFALLVTATLHEKFQAKYLNVTFPALISILIGLLLFVLVVAIRIKPEWTLSFVNLPDWGSNLSVFLGLSIVCFGFFAIFYKSKITKRVIIVIAMQSIVIVSAFHLFAIRNVSFAYDLRPAANFVREAVREGRSIAFTGEYHGQLHFIGRIEKRFAIMPVSKAAVWGQSKPRSRIVLVTKEIPPRWTGFIFIQAYRGRVMTVWNGSNFDAYIMHLRDEEQKQKQRIGAGS